MKKLTITASCLFMLVCSILSAQEERIISYDTHIEVFTDRSIEVTEDISVYVAGDIIKRGITRNLPYSRYLNDRKANVRYNILEVLKNGTPEPFHTQDNGDLVLYVGQRDVLLTPGIYDYTIKYRVKNQIGFYENFDEIYWNAIGNDVLFVVEKASCRVTLPPGAVPVQQQAYTGFRGEQGSDYTMSLDGNDIIYTVSRPLQPGEGFTIGVGFEKGLIKAPGLFQRMGAFIMVILGSIFLLPYYLYTWMRHGQDPPTPASYPIWTPPDDLSAGSINYLSRGLYETKGFTASIIDLAIKGYLKIEQEEKSGFFSKKKQFKLIKLKEHDDLLPEEEQELMVYLFSSGDVVEIKGKYDPTMEQTYKAHKSSLSSQHRNFLTQGHNAHMLIVPILVTLVVGIMGIILLSNSNYASALNTRALVVFAPLALGGLGLYAYLIRKPTPVRLDLRSRIKGFKMYLEMAEKNRLKLLNPPEMTPEHFEAILPYAFALGVEHKWSQKFKEILDKAQYKPEWHNSPSTIYFSDHFGKDFGKTMGTAVTQPSKTGSGGGSGGGGFSGGGGGGGGVGGW